MSKLYLEKFTVEKARKKQQIITTEILLFESSDSYTTIYYSDGETFLIRNTLTSLQHELLDPAIFIRVHRKYIVNKNFIKCKTDNNMGTKSNKRYLIKIKGLDKPVTVSRPNTELIRRVENCGETNQNWLIREHRKDIAND